MRLVSFVPREDFRPCFPALFYPADSAPDSATTERSPTQRSARLLAHNVRRLMAQLAMTYEDLVDATGLDSRTIRGIVRGAHTPQARTLHKLAEGLGVSTDDLFAPPVGFEPSRFRCRHESGGRPDPGQPS